VDIVTASVFFIVLVMFLWSIFSTLIGIRNILRDIRTGIEDVRAGLVDVESLLERQQ
jgi:hypothetical protein